MMEVVTRPSCILTPSTDEGPYFVDERLLRSDIRGDATGGPPEEGLPLTLALRVVDARDDCPPVTGAHIDIWHCNASGIYSDEPAEGTVGLTFLRGCQLSDDDGTVRFTTIFPGWYAGRAVHIHLKIRLFDGDTKTFEFTSQLFFDQKLVDEVLTTHDPYRTRGKPEVANADDALYDDAEGWKLTVPISFERRDGCSGSLTIGLSGLP